MEDNELIKNFLPFIFYRFLSEKLEMHMNKELVDDNLTFEQAWKDDEYKECLIDEGLCELGYFLEPRYLFRNILKKAGSDDFLEDLIKSLECINNYTIENDSQEAFDNIFEDIDFNSPKFGKSYYDKNKLISQILLNINYIDFKSLDEFAEGFEYLLNQFTFSKNEKIINTPPEVSRILAKLVTIGKTKIWNVYDPMCGLGSLLLSVSKEVEVANFCAQELNKTAYNLSRMSMISENGADWRDITLENKTVCLKVYTLADDSKIITKDISVDYIGGSYFTAQVLSADGHAVVGETVKFTIAGKTYTIKKDANGIAKLKINLIPNKYSIVTEFNAKKVKNTVTVKQVLKVYSLTVKKTAKSFTLKASLKINGKMVKGKVITFKFMGKTYKVKTDSKGIAKKTLGKTIIKKLKIGKTYTVKALYCKTSVKTTLKVR